MRKKEGKIKNCLQCGKAKYVEPWKLNKMTFCTVQCYWKYRVGKPMTNREGKQVPCSFCKNEFYVPQFKLKQDDLYCSWKCYRKDWGRKHSGEKHHMWKGGVHHSHDGYYKILVDGKRVYEHIYLMEQKLGRKLTKKEVVHHIDLNPSNNNIDNLEVMTHSEHRKLHYKLNPWAEKKKTTALC